MVFVQDVVDSVEKTMPAIRIKHSNVDKLITETSTLNIKTDGQTIPRLSKMTEESSMPNGHPEDLKPNGNLQDIKTNGEIHADRSDERDTNIELLEAIPNGLGQDTKHEMTKIRPNGVVKISDIIGMNPGRKLTDGVKRPTPDVFVISRTFSGLAGKVRDYLPDVNVINIDLDDRDVATADAISRIQSEGEVVFCDSAVMRSFNTGWERLRWAQVTRGGVDDIVNSVANREPPSYPVTRTVANSRLTAEYVITYILAIEKRVLPLHSAQKCKQWKQLEFNNSRILSSLSICILGVGSVGTEVARGCKHLGMTVYGVGRSDPANKSKTPYLDYYTNKLLGFLPHCDYLCNTLPSTPETRGLLSGHLLSACQSNKPVFINVGRGDLIDEPSILTAISESWISGAVLDVSPQEPLAESSPLWSLNNVIITPHVAGFNKTEGMVSLLAREFAENYRRYCSGGQLLHEINFTLGY